MLPWLLVAALARAGAPDAATVEAPEAPENSERLQEFAMLYGEFEASVRAKLADGWTYGLSGDARINAQTAAYGYSTDSPATLENNVIEAKRLRLRAERIGNQAGVEAYTERIEELEHSLQRTWGICTDWSNVVTRELTAIPLRHWTIEEVNRTEGYAHWATRVCRIDRPGSLSSCVIFDAWKRGRPDLYDAAAWDQGRFVEVPNPAAQPGPVPVPHPTPPR